MRETVLRSWRAPQARYLEPQKVPAAAQRKPWDVSGGDRENREHPDWKAVRGQSVALLRDVTARVDQDNANASRNALLKQARELEGKDGD